MGFVFYPPSPRYIAPERAAEIIARLPPFVTTTGLFVDADEQAVRNVLAHVPAIISRAWPEAGL